MSTYRLDRLFAPRSVVLVGGSAREHSVGQAILGNLRAGGFAGPVHLVNPRHSEIDGIRACNSIADLPDVPDVAIVATPAAEVPAVVAAAGAKGCAAAIVITAGLGHGPGSLSDGADGQEIACIDTDQDHEVGAA